MQMIGDYVVLEELARGGQGVVYRARQGDREVAIKLLLAGAAATEGQRRRFQTEIQAMAQLRHPGIVSVHAAGEHQGAPYYVMDLVQGESLAHVLRREGRLDSERAGEVILALSEALATAHTAGVLHRDLKPDNVLIDESGRPRLTDFGLALQLEADRMTRSGQLLGTPGYWAPEQAAGRQSKVGTTTDVYGLGATLYALLTGGPPFVGRGLDELVAATVGRKPKRPTEIVADVDRRLEEICMRCLEKDPGKRFGSASELATALSAWRRGEDYPRAPWVRLTLTGLALTGGLLAGLWFGLREPTPVSTPTQPVTETPPPALGPALEELLPPLPWPPAVGQEARYTLRLETLAAQDIGVLPGYFQLELSQRVERVEGGVVYVNAALSGIRFDTTDISGLIHMKYDSSESEPGLLEDVIRPLLGTHVRWTHSALSGEVLSLEASFAVNDPGTYPGVPVRELLLGHVASLLSASMIRGMLQNTWHVFPDPNSGEPQYAVDALLMARQGVGYQCRREFTREGDLIHVEGLMPARLRRAPRFVAPGMRATDIRGQIGLLKGELRFGHVGLERSRLEYRVEEGDAFFHAQITLTRVD